MTTLSLPSHDDPSYRVAISRFQLTQKIPYGDPFWSKFNASFDNRDVTAGELMSAVYLGHAFTTWHAHHWRTSQNYEVGQHLALDFDSDDQRSTLGALAQDPFIKKYGSFVYTTPSHTPEKPRARAVFLLDTPIMQAKNYALAAQALLWVFGSADRQCKDAARFFYGSKGCEIEYLENILPLAVVKNLIAKYQETGLIHKRQALRKRDDTPPELQEIEQVLDLIDPWGIDYGDWVRCLMALHSEYGDAALGLAERWGKGEGDEIAKKWRSFHGNGNGAGRVTIATIYDIAKRFGWQYQKAA